MNRKSTFPALVIAPLSLLVCLFPGQGWLAHGLPGLSGRATVDPGLTIFDIPLHLSFPIDLILVPGLFIFLYSIAILINSARQQLPLWQHLMQRLGAILASIFIILFCVTLGALLSWLLRDHLPGQLRNGMKSLAVSADLHLPYAGYKTLPLQGDIFSLLGLVIGIAIGIGIINKSPRLQRTTPLTREQRMTPYQRMLQERRNGTTPAFHAGGATPALRRYESSPAPGRYEPSRGLCRNEPLVTIRPEAVNYRPLE